jgi:hypothetical protein
MRGIYPAGKKLAKPNPQIKENLLLSMRYGGVWRNLGANSATSTRLIQQSLKNTINVSG